MAELAGCVRDDLQPPLAPGELRVLGQTMHPLVAQAYQQVREHAAQVAHIPRMIARSMCQQTQHIG
jgi:hypothetical protein